MKKICVPTLPKISRPVTVLPETHLFFLFLPKELIMKYWPHIRSFVHYRVMVELFREDYTVHSY